MQSRDAVAKDRYYPVSYAAAYTLLFRRFRGMRRAGFAYGVKRNTVGAWVTS
jgi:hypothetical protein